MEQIKVISGGQTGIDRMAIYVAYNLEIPTGGEAPKGWMTENGPDYSLKQFGLRESEGGYAFRTEANVLESDATVIYGDVNSTGSKLTERLCVHHHKPCIVNPRPEILAEFIIKLDIKILNVAGNRYSKIKNDLPMYTDMFTQGLRLYLQHGQRKENLQLINGGKE